MLEWLLSEPYFSITHFVSMILILTIIVKILIIGYLGFDNKKRKKSEIVFESLKNVIYFLIIIITLHISLHTTEEYTPNSEWKEIYTNKIEANFELNLIIRPIVEFKTKLTPNQPLGDLYNQIKTTTHGTLIATKGQSSETKQIHLDASNVIVNGTLNSNSKITKIEYRSVDGKRYNAFGRHGNKMRSDFDGEIRITIDSDSTEEENSKQLKNLFGE